MFTGLYRVMTYCIGLNLDEGLVLASDSRTNAGVDHIRRAGKMRVFAKDGERVIVTLSAGNLSLTQNVLNLLEHRAMHEAGSLGMLNARSMFQVAQIVGDARKNGVTVREVDVSFSFAQNTLEEKVGEHCAVRLGFRQIDGFHWLDEDEERLKALQSSFSDAQLRIVGTRSMGVPESGTHERMGSLPPCGGELERGVATSTARAAHPSP